jgi:hypothetical protein
MSIHGDCFDEGQRGNCGPDCWVYQDGRCEIEDEIQELEDGSEPIIEIIESEVMRFI